MGEIADDMMEGGQCDLCGCIFKHPDADKHAGTTEDPQPSFEHGHPATCWDCWKDLTPQERKSHVRARVPTY